jgi:spore coat protein CotH
MFIAVRTSFVVWSFFACSSLDAGSDGGVIDAGSEVDASTDVDAGIDDRSQRPEYELVFDRSRVPSWHLIFEATDWAQLQANWDVDVSADVEFEEERHENVGVHFKGNVTLDFAGEKKSWKLDFDEFVPDARFHGLETINLHNGFKDPTIMRELFAYDLHAAAGNVASRTSHARVYVTVPGIFDREYFGLFIQVEEVDKRWVRDRFADDEGNLYKEGDFRWYGPDWTDYVPGIYEPKTNKSSVDHLALLRFLDALNNSSDAELETALEEVFDVERFLGWLTANTLLSNMDGIPGGAGNCYVYHDVAEDRLVLIPWDMNEAFGSTSEGLSIDELIELDVFEPVVYPGAQPLIERILEVPVFRARYQMKLQEMVDGPFSEAVLGPSIDMVRDQIREHVHADTKRHYSIDQFERSFEEDVPGLPNPPYPEGNRVIGLKRFIRERAVSVRSQL